MTADPPIDRERSAASAIASPALEVAVSPPSTLRRDIVSGYVLTISRIAAWAAVSAIVFRQLGAEAFAILALLRVTISLIGYTSFGIGPAMVQLMAEAQSRLPFPFAKPGPWRRTPPRVLASPVLPYATPPEKEPLPPVVRVFSAGADLLRLPLGIATILVLVFSSPAAQAFGVPKDWRQAATYTIMAFAFGSIFRIMAEPSSALLQVRGRLALDNFIAAAGEWAWVFLVVVCQPDSISTIAFAWTVASAGMAFLRIIARMWFVGNLYRRDPDADVIRGRIFWFGVGITVAQLADFLYAPTDYILINRLLGVEDLATYAPLMQIDSGLLLLVSGLALALFPHASLAHAAGDRTRLKSLYLKATAASAAMLLAAGGLAWILSPIIFRVWLGNDLPAARALLPLVLIHTVVGGSSAVGRSILLGMGRVKAFTASVLIAGAANVVLSAIFALIFGLKGIVLGTIVVVVARCAIWMPWYVLRSLRESAAKVTTDSAATSLFGAAVESRGGGSA